MDFDIELGNADDMSLAEARRIARLIKRLTAYITPELADMRPDLALRFIARRVLADLPREKDPTP
jgi:hypothetical protein